MPNSFNYKGDGGEDITQVPSLATRSCWMDPVKSRRAMKGGDFCPLLSDFGQHKSGQADIHVVQENFHTVQLHLL